MPEYPNKDRFAAARERMLRWHLRGRDITDPRVLAAMAEVPREDFVPPSHLSQAYADGPLPIGAGQTISQPYIVALMTQELRVTGDCEVLEIGTGSGYQTAVLARLAGKVYTIERFAELSQSARAVLAGLGISNVEFHVGDGSCGWPEQRSFDRIMITAAVPQVPSPLTKQIVDGGTIVAPVGSGSVQQLVAFEKTPDQLIGRFICDVRFVRVLGLYGFEEG
ncbi:MAG: protein-L-isoaspartate(D-aspartate) O-methyltransferase [Phycisphaerales bacterium]|nr:MAG: protein-L-isoaspartate(D-aspartate) O-methyltransferase [Phycisphaerales bacterium]